MSSRVMATTALLLTLTAGGTTASADYGVQVAGNCQIHPTLAAALAIGATIYVSGVNVENAVTVIGRDAVLRTASANCNPGGSGGIELAAGVLDRVLEVLPGTTLDKMELTLRGVTVSGGDIVGDGGTIYLHPDSSLFMQAGASVEQGGATGRGGCIYADSAKIVMQAGTSVAGCTANSDGGGVAISGGHAPGAYHVLFGIDGNAAVTGHGGGAWVDSAQVCLFDATGNSAAQDGGAAYVTSGLDTTAWLGAFDLQEFNAAGRDGGGIFVSGPGSSLDAVSWIQDNNAEVHGGGVRVTGEAIAHLGPGNRIASNSARGDGGGVHGDASAFISVADVGDVVAIGDGEMNDGICANASGAVSIEDNLAGFDANGVEVSPDRNGGAVYVSAATFDGTTILGAPLTVSGNIASDNGGGLAAFATSSVVLQLTDFASNAANHGDGGGLVATDGSVVDLVDVHFETNSAAEGGGGAAVEAASATLSDVRFDGNTAPAGGGLGLNGGATVDIVTADIVGNGALSGGGVGVFGGSTLTMLRGTVDSNTGDVGGGIAAVSATVILGEAEPQCPQGGACVTISANVASGTLGRGGGIALAGPGAQVEVRRTRIVANLADHGGATWMDRDDHTLYIHNSAVLDNHANGGLVSAVMVGAGELAILDSTIAHNDVGITLVPPAAATMRDSLVIQNLVDIAGLGLGASMTGDCNGVQFAATQAAIAGVDNVATTSATASVNAVSGRPINTADIVDQCSNGLLPRDLRGLPRPAGASFDRGAYEMQ